MMSNRNWIQIALILTTILLVGSSVACSHNLAPKTKLEKKVAYFIRVLGKKKQKTNSIKTFQKNIIKEFQKVVDIQLITQKVLAKHLESFTAQEIDTFQRSFLMTLLGVANQKIQSNEYGNIKMKFIKYPWKKKTRIVAMEAKVSKDGIPINLVLEFDQKKDVLINFYFADISLTDQYKEQFTQILDSKGKKEFLSIMQKKLDSQKKSDARE